LKIYFDTSFLISLYSLDVNSSSAAAAVRASKGDRFVTTFAELEVCNALQLRVFRKELSMAQAESSSTDFENDLQSGVFQLRPLPEQVFERARALSRSTTAKFGTRTADLLHVAAALELTADYLYSFDQRQRKLAQSVRLKLNKSSLRPAPASPIWEPA
jgi:predicted nucleic acid-binding protein